MENYLFKLNYIFKIILLNKSNSNNNYIYIIKITGNL